MRKVIVPAFPHRNRLPRYCPQMGGIRCVAIYSHSGASGPNRLLSDYFDTKKRVGPFESSKPGIQGSESRRKESQLSTASCGWDCAMIGLKRRARERERERERERQTETNQGYHIQGDNSVFRYAFPGCWFACPRAMN